MRITRVKLATLVALASMVTGISALPAPAAASMDGPAAQAEVATCSFQNYTGGRWLTIDLCSNNAWGFSGFVERQIWMDYATSSHPLVWTSHVGLQQNSYMTLQAPKGSWYWRTCVNASPTVYCTAWYRA